MGGLQVINAPPMHPMANWLIEKFEASFKGNDERSCWGAAVNFGSLAAVGMAMASREQAEAALLASLRKRGVTDYTGDMAEHFQRGCESNVEVGDYERYYTVGFGEDSPLPAVMPSDWIGKPEPEREWTVEGMIPRRTVTLFSGDGGTGKTLTAIQLIIAMQLDQKWLGQNTMPGRALLYTAEDDPDELQRRFSKAMRKAGRELSELPGVCVIPMVGLDAVLAEPDETGQIAATKVWKQLIVQIREHMPSLVVIDPAADVFGGDEIDRAQVRQFVQMLAGVALRYNCAVLLLSHPSQAGLISGTGTSGSTAWNNSVRSRLYLEAVKGEPNKRILRVMKSNYGKTGTAISMRWDDGVYVVDNGDDPATVATNNSKADEVFISVFKKLSGQGQVLGPNKSPSYAPKKIASHTDAKGFKSATLADAMQRLLDAGKLQINEDGPKSRRRQVLALASN